MSYDEEMLDKWLLTTEGGATQLTNKSLIKKKKRGIQSTFSQVYTRKIRVYPADEHQHSILPKWFGAARWVYNRCLDFVRDGTCKPNRSGGLREVVVNDANYVNTNEWMLEVPRDVRAGAYQDLIDAYASNFAKKKMNPAHTFELRRRGRKDPQERIYIDKRRYQRGVIYPSKFGKVPFKSKEPLPNHLNHDAHLIRTRLGHYYLCITLDVKRDENQVPSTTPLRIASIDPGVRTPHTLYDPAGTLIEFGPGAIGRLYRLSYHLDDLQSRIARLPRSKEYHRKRWRMRRAWHRASLKIRNLVDEYHKQVVHFLVNNYDIVLLPALETSKLIPRTLRKLSSKAARALVTWAHYRFRQRLLWKCQSTGCKVIVCGEAYTSKTCGQCGELHHSLGKKKVFHCSHCDVILDRDANGARNILLKNASRFGLLVDATLGLTPVSKSNDLEDARPSRPQVEEDTAPTSFAKNC